MAALADGMRPVVDSVFALADGRGGVQAARERRAVREDRRAGAGLMRIPLATRYADYDTKGHVNNAVFLTYFEMARAAAWVEGCGGSADFPFILAEATVKYVSEAMIGAAARHRGDDRRRCGRRRGCGRTRSATSRDGRVVAEGRTVQVMYDYERQVTIPIPDALRARLAAL